jgi:hypothetical protein
MKAALKTGIAGALVAAASVWFYSTPYLAVHSMRAAVDAKDAPKLSRYIDFPAVRESVKATLNAKMMSQMAKINKSESPFAGIGAAFAMAMVGPMVDAMITPEGMAMMMKGERPTPDRASAPARQPELQPVAQKSEPEIETSMFYEGFDQFVVTVKQVASSDEPIGFVMQRQGLFSWKVVSVRLPL